MTKQPIFFGWWLVAAGFLLQGAVTSVVSYSYGSILAPIAAEFSASRFEMMLGITACTLVSGLISPWLGIAIDRHSLRRLAVLGVLMLAAGLLLMSFARVMWHVVALFAVFMSVAMGLMGPMLVSSMLARWFTRKRGAAMGIAALGTSVCGFFVPPLLQLGIDELGWRTALQLMGAGILLVALPAAMLLQSDPRARGLAPDGDDAAATGPTQAAIPGSSSTAQVLKQKNFWLVALTLGVLFSVYSALLSNLVPFALGRGISGERAAFLVSAIAVFGMLGKLLFGVVADRVDLRAGLAAAILMVMLSLLMFIADAGYLLLLASSCVLGFAAGGMLPVWGAMMALLFGAANFGRVMGLMNPVMMPLVIIGSPFAGWSFDATGDYVVAFVSFAVVLVVGLLAVSQVRLPARAN